MKIRFKRLFAFLIDWYVILIPAALITPYIPLFLNKQFEENPWVDFISLFIYLFPLGAFLLKDAVCKGRSVGKRLFGLYVYDQKTLKQADTKQCVLKNVFLFLCVFDAIILLVTGKTLGDRVAGTLVTSKQDLELYEKEIQDVSAMYTPPGLKKKKTKKAILIFAIIIGCLLAFVGLIQVILNQQKDTEEYKIAYDYFTESKAFEELNVDESKIHFNQYSSHTYTAKNNNSVSQTVEIGFVVNFKSFEVVCHKENDIWQVCNECTLFE